MSEVSVINQAEEPAGLDLPPGFRFHPTDEEIVSHYLTPKALDCRFTTAVVGEVDLNKCEPWDLPGKAKMGEKEWWFFCHKDRKYPTGMRTNRATESGYWKATGKDKEIFRGRGILVGMKKTLVFYLGRAPRGEKTGWVMHEFRLDGKLPHLLPRATKDEWAVCRVFNKDFAARNGPMAPGAAAATGLERTNSFAFTDDFLSSTELPPLMDPPFCTDVAEVIDFKGGAAGAQAVPGATYQVKMEQPVQQQQQQLLYASPYSPYFSLPVVASGDMPPAIRRYCKAEQLSGQTSSTDRHTAGGAEISSAVTSAQQFLDLDDLSTVPAMDLAADLWEY